MNNIIKLLLPITLGLIAGGVNFWILRESTGKMYVQASKNIEPGDNRFFEKGDLKIVSLPSMPKSMQCQE